MLFQSLFKRAERSFDSAVDSAIDRLLASLAVGVPILIAVGFATTALSIKLIEMYGTVAACALMASLFATLGLIAMAVNGKSHTSSDETESGTQTGNDSERQRADSSPALPPEVMAILTSVAPTAAPGIARGVARNLPLILMLALIGFVVSRFAVASDDEASESGAPSSDQQRDSDPEEPQAAA